MIIGIGSDIVDISRIESLLERHEERFGRRVFTELELKRAYGSKPRSLKRVAASLAKRFAAKEAVLKALGTGLANGISWQDVEVLNQSHTGQPHVTLKGRALEILNQLAGEGRQAIAHLSLSDDGGKALAFVVLSVIADVKEDIPHPSLLS